MNLIDVRLVGTTETDGSLTVNADRSFFGFLYAVEWIDGAFEDGVDAVVSIQTTSSGVAQTVATLTDANSDLMYYPRSVVHSEAGVALTGTAGGDRAMFVINGTPRLVVASGGSAKLGGCILYITED